MHRIVAALVTLFALTIGGAFAQVAVPKPAEGQAVATFAGGCFWCVESDFDKIDGVLSTTSGFMGGTTPNPTYKQVTGGGTGHLEVVQIVFDPAKVTYQKLLDVFWRTVDPYDAGGQFCDRGDIYATAIFAHGDEQLKLAEASKQAVAQTGPKGVIATIIRAAGPFTPAEDYHQDYYKKNPVRYQYYRLNCGRDARLKQLWGSQAGH